MIYVVYAWVYYDGGEVVGIRFTEEEAMKLADERSRNSDSGVTLLECDAQGNLTGRRKRKLFHAWLDDDVLNEWSDWES